MNKWGRNHQKGAGVLIVFATFILVAMIGMSLYRYKGFERDLQIQSSVSDDIRAGYAAEFALQQSFEFLREGFRTDRVAGTFNGLSVVSIPDADCRVDADAGVPAGCFQFSKSIDISEEDRIANPALPEQAAFFLKCEGNCGLTPSHNRPSLVTGRAVAFMNGSVQSVQFVARVGKGTAFTPGTVVQGDPSGSDFQGPIHVGGSSQLSKAAIKDLKSQCGLGEASYETYLKKYLSSNVCPSVSVASVKDVAVAEVSKTLLSDTGVISAVGIKSKTLSSIADLSGATLEKIATVVQPAMGFLTIADTINYLKTVSEEDFLADVYPLVFAPTLSASSLSVAKSGATYISKTPAPPADFSYLKLSSSAGISTRSANVKKVELDVPSELSFAKVCADDSKYPDYAQVNTEIDNWIDELDATSAGPTLVKNDCAGKTCDVEITCESKVNKLKVTDGDGVATTHALSVASSVFYSEKPITILKAEYCSHKDAGSLSIVSKEPVVIAAPIVPKELLEKEYLEWDMDKLQTTAADMKRKIGIVSKKEVRADATRMKHLKKNASNKLEYGTSAVGLLDSATATSDQLGSVIVADIATKESLEVSQGTIDSKPILISGAVATSKLVKSHLISAKADNTCRNLGSKVLVDGRPSVPGDGPQGPPLSGSVDIEIIRITTGNEEGVAGL